MNYRNEINNELSALQELETNIELKVKNTFKDRYLVSSGKEITLEELQVLIPKDSYKYLGYLDTYDWVTFSEHTDEVYIFKKSEWKCICVDTPMGSSYETNCIK